MKRLYSFVTLILMVVFTMSCANDMNMTTDNTNEITTGTTNEQSNEEYTGLRENTPDSLPELDYDGMTVRIAHRGDEITYRVETVGEETGDIVSDAVWARNRSVEERLNVKLEFIAGQSDYEAYMSDIRKIIMAGEDLYDIIDAIQWRVVPQAIEGLYHNLIDAPYLDFSKPWWSNEYMNEISVTTNTRFLLSGDISIWQLRNMSCMYFNKGLYEENFGDPNSLYQTVLDGNWTYELLNQYVKDIYRDINSDGITDENDILGIGSTPVAQTDHFAYTAGLSFTDRDADGYPMLLQDQSRNVEIVENLYRLYYENPGTIIYSSANAMDNELIKLFTDGRMLFYPNRFYTAELLRDMTDPYGIIPFPKLDEEQQNYSALVHDGTTLFAIPVTKVDIEPSCAVLEAMCAENYRTVTPAYYEVALKIKYTQDDISAEIIDMIHENVRTDFIYAANYCFTSSVKLGTIVRNLMGMGQTASSDYMSAYDSIKGTIQTELENIISSVE